MEDYTPTHRGYRGGGLHTYTQRILEVPGMEDYTATHRILEVPGVEDYTPTYRGY